MESYERKADQLEREADDMEERTERLEDDIQDTRRDWEAKKQDSAVPGAEGDREARESETPVDPLGPKPDEEALDPQEPGGGDHETR